jgi:heme oxygenase
MSLKELTAEKHNLAESTPFMKAIFAKKLPIDLWADYTYQRSLIYNGIEGVAGACGLLKDLPDIQRAHYLYLDYKESTNNELRHSYRQSAIDYYKYILSLYPDENKILAHLYVWHMGDMYGGQMIKKIIPGTHLSLSFKDTEKLKQTLRSKLTDDLATEANVAFDWAIKLLNEYDNISLE